MRQSQRSVNYRLGAPMTQCGCCQMYRKAAQSVFGTCTEVSGKITTYGVCQRFSALNNPFGNALNDQTRVELANHYAQIRAAAGRQG